MDPVKNFAKVNVAGAHASGDTTIELATGQVAELPDPAVDGAFNLVWWDATLYDDPADDPNVEIVRVTAITGDDLTVVRGQEGTTASNKNTTDSSYKMILAFTKASYDALVQQIQDFIQGVGNLIDSDGTQLDDDAILYETNIVGGRLGTKNAVRITIPISSLVADTVSQDTTFNLIYGATTIATFTLTSLNGGAGVHKGVIEAMLFANGSNALQKGFIQLVAGENAIDDGGDPSTVAMRLAHGAGYGTGTEDSTQTLAIKVTCSLAESEVTAEGAVFELLSSTGAGAVVSADQQVPYGYQSDSSSSDENFMLGNCFGDLERLFGFFSAQSNDNARLYEWRKDPLTGNYIYVQNVQLPTTSGASRAYGQIVGEYIYVLSERDSDGVIEVYRYDASDISTSPTLMSLSTAVSFGSNRFPFYEYEGDLYLCEDGIPSPSGEFVFERWTVSGTTLTKTVDTVTHECTSIVSLAHVTKINGEVYFVGFDSGSRFVIERGVIAVDGTTTVELLYNSLQTIGFGGGDLLDNGIGGIGFGGGAGFEIYFDRLNRGGGTSSNVFTKTIQVKGYSLFA